jgi:hypothetical protein
MLFLVAAAAEAQTSLVVAAVDQAGVVTRFRHTSDPEADILLEAGESRAVVPSSLFSPEPGQGARRYRLVDGRIVARPAGDLLAEARPAAKRLLLSLYLQRVSSRIAIQAALSDHPGDAGLAAYRTEVQAAEQAAWAAYEAAP